MSPRSIIAVLTVLFFAVLPVSAESNPKRLGPYTMYEQIIYLAKQRRILEHISDDMAEGRATGTRANEMIAAFIKDEYARYGLEPFKSTSYFQPFMVDSVKRARNVVGIVPSAVPSDKYVIICAHYDHLGILNGNIYNGADDNASGVTALLNLADIFGTMKKTRTGPDKNILFVALDAKENNMAGSKYFVDSLGIDKENIVCAINLERIGTVIEPVHENDTSFAIVLGENTLPKDQRGKIRLCNTYYKIGLDLDFTFYGSEKFTDLYYRLSDQIVFHEAGIPALLFTSGFHRHTYKVSDDPEIISYPVLKQRTLLVFYFVMML